MSQETQRAHEFFEHCLQNGYQTPHTRKDDDLASKLNEVETGVRPGRFRYLFYGEQKIGKSTIAAAAPDSIFIDLEGGLRFIKCARYPWPKNVDLTMAHVQEAIMDLTQNRHSYRHLWIDGLEILEALIHGVVVPAAARRTGKKWEHLDEIGGGFGKGARMALRNWREFINLLERLQDATGMSVGILGHAKLGKRKDVGTVDWDCWTPNIESGAWNVLADWVDAFIFMGFEQGGTKDANDMFARGKGWQTGTRYMYTARSATHYAGCRFPMPDRIEMIDPNQGDPWAPFAHTIDVMAVDGNEMIDPNQGDPWASFAHTIDVMAVDGNEILAMIAYELKRISDDKMTETTNRWLEEKRSKDQLIRTLRKLRTK